VSADGTLAFSVRAEAHGIANLKITLQDDGETAYNGVDRSQTETIRITVYPIVRTPYIVPLQVVTAIENSGPILLGDFVTIGNNSRYPDLEFAHKTVSFAVSSNSAYFEYLKIVPDGTVDFQVKSFVFGNPIVTLTMTIVHTNRQYFDAENFTIQILPVNQAPVYSLNTSLIPIEVHEDEFISGVKFESLFNLVKIYLKGPNITTNGPS